MDCKAAETKQPRCQRKLADSFQQQQSCNKALQQHPYQEVDLTQGRQPGADSDPLGSNHFFRSLVLGIDGIRDVQAFATSTELMMFFALGTAIDGHTGMAHGGFIATILDNLCGFAAHLITRHAGLFTVQLDIRYCGAIKTPGIIIGRAHVASDVGRKVLTVARLEDESGSLCAEARCLFIKSKTVNSL